MYLEAYQSIQKKNKTSSFVQKQNSRTNFVESNFEEEIDSKNQLRDKNSADPNNIGEPFTKVYVFNKFNDLSVLETLNMLLLKIKFSIKFDLVK